MTNNTVHGDTVDAWFGLDVRGAGDVNANGIAALSDIRAPNDPNLIGRPLSGQWICADAATHGFAATLTNALVGAKVAITSTRPQTTRHAIRGIVHSDDFQIILVDTPGLHRPRTLLGKRLNDLVRETYAAVDVIGLCIPADEAIGPGDRWIVEQLRSTGPANTTLVVIVTKIDKVPKEKVVAQLVAVSELVTNAAEIVPVSAMTGDNRPSECFRISFALTLPDASAGDTGTITPEN